MGKTRQRTTEEKIFVKCRSTHAWRKYIIMFIANEKWWKPSIAVMINQEWGYARFCTVWSPAWGSTVWNKLLCSAWAATTCKWWRKYTKSSQGNIVILISSNNCFAYNRSRTFINSEQTLQNNLWNVALTPNCNRTCRGNWNQANKNYFIYLKIKWTPKRHWPKFKHNMWPFADISKLRTA